MARQKGYGGNAGTTGKSAIGVARIPPEQYKRDDPALRQLLKDVLIYNLPQMNTWIQEVAEKNPAEAAKLLLQLTNHVLPVMKITESKNETVNENHIQISMSTDKETQNLLDKMKAQKKIDSAEDAEVEIT